eukprot:SM000197S05480  [mRNA]  locus=s197:159950:161417:- [translate_table: standard]
MPAAPHAVMEAPLELQEDGVPWERLRAPPVACDPFAVFESADARSAHIGDRFELQWRFHDDMPFTWCVGHFAFCGEGGAWGRCVCAKVDALCLTFPEYGCGLIWRKSQHADVAAAAAGTLLCLCQQGIMERSMSGEQLPALSAVKQRFARIGFRGHGFVGGLRIIPSQAEVDAWLRSFPLNLPP